MPDGKLNTSAVPPLVRAIVNLSAVKTSFTKTVAPLFSVPLDAVGGLRMIIGSPAASPWFVHSM